MKYKLLYENLELGEVEQKSFDSPNTFGKYALKKHILEENLLIKEYVEYSIQAGLLMEKDEQEWLKHIEKEEYKFEVLIESESWKLIDDKDNTCNILIPIFYHNHEIVWRWD